MCDIKFWKGNENLRSVDKKRFSKFWVVSSIFYLSVLKKVHCTFYPSFRTDFKNVHMTLVKSAPKKVLAKKLLYQLKICKKNHFLGKTFFRCTFYKGLMYIFEISMKRRIFLYPIRPNQRKKFSSHIRVSVYFL